MWLAIKISADLLGASTLLLAKTLLIQQPDRRFYLATVALVSLPFAVIGCIHLIGLAQPIDALIGIAAGITYIASGNFYYRALQTADPAHISLIFRLSPVIVLVLSAALLQEHLSSSQYAAFGLALLGSLSLVIQPHQQFQIEPATRDALLSASLGALSTTLTAYLTNHYSVLVTFNLTRIGVILGTVLLIHPIGVWHAFRAHTGQLSRQQSRMMIIEQLLRLGSSFLNIVAIQRLESASLVSVLSGFTPIYVWLLTPAFTRTWAKRTRIAPQLLALLLFLLSAWLMT